MAVAGALAYLLPVAYRCRLLPSLIGVCYRPRLLQSLIAVAYRCRYSLGYCCRLSLSLSAVGYRLSLSLIAVGYPCRLLPSLIAADRWILCRQEETHNRPQMYLRAVPGARGLAWAEADLLERSDDAMHILNARAVVACASVTPDPGPTLLRSTLYTRKQPQPPQYNAPNNSSYLLKI